MITAISNFNGHNSKVNSANYNSGNETRKANNSSQVIDSFANSKQVSFKGNLAKVGENLLGDAGSKIGGKVRRLGEGIMEAASGAFRKLVGKNELPISDKAVIAPTVKDDSLLKKAQELFDKAPYHSSDRSKLDSVLSDPKYIKGTDNLTPGYQSELEKTINSIDPTHFKGDYVPSGGVDGPVGGGSDFDCDSGDFDSLLSLLGS